MCKAQETMEKYITDTQKGWGLDTERLKENDYSKQNYYNQGSIPLDAFIQDWNLDYFTGALLKYILRHRFKNGIEDLNKARRCIDLLEKQFRKENKID